MNYKIPIYKLSLLRDGSVAAERRIVGNSGESFQILNGYFAHHDREEMVVMLLDAKHKVIGINTVSIGSLTMSIVHPRETFKAAIVSNCSAIILSHNHPSLDPTPSQEDRVLTKRLKECGDLLGIPVLDHIVVGGDRYYSFADQGEL